MLRRKGICHSKAVIHSTYFLLYIFNGNIIGWAGGRGSCRNFLFFICSSMFWMGLNEDELGFEQLNGDQNEITTPLYKPSLNFIPVKNVRVKINFAKFLEKALDSAKSHVYSLFSFFFYLLFGRFWVKKCHARHPRNSIFFCEFRRNFFAICWKHKYFFTECWSLTV